jgi:hypothetical protein
MRGKNMSRLLVLCSAWLILGCGTEFSGKKQATSASGTGDARATQSPVNDITSDSADGHLASIDAEPRTDPDSAVNDLCVGAVCLSPPLNECAEDGGVITFSHAGWCVDGTCSYASAAVTCEEGTCVDGICASMPCIGVTCNETPEATCEDAKSRREFAPFGFCVAGQTGPECVYSHRTADCESGCEAENASMMNVLD